MSLLDVIKGLLGIVPSAIEAGKQVADAVKPGVVIDPNDATLWHTVHYTEGWYMVCNVCGLKVMRAAGER